MFRKMMLGVVAAAVGFGAQAATAQEPGRFPPRGGPGGGFVPPHQYHDHDYVVLVRHNGHWDRYGRYETRREAERAERYLEGRGYRVRVEVVEDRRRDDRRY